MTNKGITRDEQGKFVGKGNIYKIENGVCNCYWGGKYIFTIDVEDYERVSQYNWYKTKNGYIASTAAKTTLHRYITNAEKGELIDHVNRNKLDNRKSNLRKADKSINAFNSKRRNTNTSGVVGVYFRNDTQRWVANIKVDYRKITLGCFDTKEEAAKVRKRAEIEYFGEVRK